jgi:hypothetical protein
MDGVSGEYKSGRGRQVPERARAAAAVFRGAPAPRTVQLGRPVGGRRRARSLATS